MHKPVPPFFLQTLWPELELPRSVTKVGVKNKDQILSGSVRDSAQWEGGAGSAACGTGTVFVA